MTIDSGWTKIIKEGAPSAFTQALPVKPFVVFIDGQINLMKADYINTWALFLEKQFISKIDNAFSLGARVVVLAFDNYEHVPSAKNMTQQKRSRSVPVLKFDEKDDLPPILPDNWPGAMRNRHFKCKVAAFVAQNLRIKYKDHLHGSVVIDFKDEVEVIGQHYELPSVLQDKVSQGFRGECDIKAFAYMTTNGPLLIESTDGDFLPISLVQIRKHLDLSGVCPVVILHRILTNVDTEATKRSRDGKGKREYEYVNMPLILDWVEKELNFVSTPVEAFAALVATTGCDFCMNLPWIGPKTLWAIRNKFSTLDLKQPQDLLLAISHVYHNKYREKIGLRAPEKCMAETLTEMVDMAEKQYGCLSDKIKQSSKITPRIKDSVWSRERMIAHIGNTLWTIQYWTNIYFYKDPCDPEFGYKKVGVGLAFAGLDY